MTTYTSEQLSVMTQEERVANLATLKAELAAYIDNLSDADIIKVSRIIIKAILSGTGSLSTVNSLATTLKDQVGDY